MSFREGWYKPPIKESDKKKKVIRRQERREKLEATKERTRRGENYGDIKISRRIPIEVSDSVRTRDIGRDFGRPNHSCPRPGSPHHIIHFEKFLNGEEQGDPHRPENLEAPCKDCHDLAHKIGIPSGVPIAKFFKEQLK